MLSLNLQKINYTRKVVIMAGLIGMVMSCGAEKTSENENHDSENPEVVEVIEDKVETLQYSSFGILKEFNIDKSAFFNKIIGNEVVISDVLFFYLNVYENVDKNTVVSCEGPGYMFNSGGDDLYSGYSVPSEGVINNVNGKVMAEYKDVPRSLILNQIILTDGITEIKQAEKDGEDETATYYHTKGTISINGGLITEKGENLKLNAGELSDITKF